MSWIIKDWAGNKCVTDNSFPDFDEAEAFLAAWFDYKGLDYEEERQEYEIEEQ